MQHSLRAWLWRYKSQILASIIWIVMGIVANVYMRINDLTPVQFAEELSHMLGDTGYGALLYVALYFLRPLTFFPGTPFTIMAGYVYGVWWGFIYAMIAGLVSTLIPYVTGRWFSDRRQLKKLLAERKSHLISFIGTMQDNPFQTTLTTRFLYLPYDLVNFAAGSLHVPFTPFITATALGNLINAFILVSVGASIEASLSEGEFKVDARLLVLSIAIWLLSYVITRYFKRRQEELEAQ